MLATFPHTPSLHPHTQAHTPLPCSNLITFPGSQDFLCSLSLPKQFPNLQVAAAFEPEQLGHNPPAFLHSLKYLFLNRHP